MLAVVMRAEASAVVEVRARVEVVTVEAKAAKAAAMVVAEKMVAARPVVEEIHGEVVVTAVMAAMTRVVARAEATVVVARAAARARAKLETERAAVRCC